MAEIAVILVLGTALVLGLGHSLDPDHVVAVSAILCKCTSFRKSIVSATAWGAGHSATILIAGLLILGLSISIPERILSLFDAGAGVMLIILGALLLRPIIATNLHMRSHKNDPNAPARHSHTHAHSHTPKEGTGHGHIHKSAFTGALQGLGGSAAIMLVALASVNSAELGLVFIAIFCVGVIVGMICIASAIGSVLKYTSTHLESIHEKINLLAGCISIGFGLFLILQVVFGLHIYS